ncbi:MAG: MFS transporter [Actinomycetota bacterium]
MGFVRKGLRDAGRTLREAAQWGPIRRTPYGLTPALVLGLLTMVRIFDFRIFGLVLPDIVRDLDISVVAILTVGNLTGFVIIFATLGFGHLLDRVRRVPFVAAGMVMQAAGTLTRPHMRTVAPLGALGISDTVGYNVSLVPDVSLLTDYYPPETRGRVLAFVGMMFRIGFYVSPLCVGLLTVNYGWRWPFYVTGPILAGCAILVLALLREPVRGLMERRALGLKETEAQKPEPPPRYGHAWRTIWGIGTMRRLFLSDIAQRVGDGITGAVYVFFLFEEYSLDALDRGKLFTFLGLFSIVGSFFGGGVIDSLMRRGRPQRTLVLSGAFIILRAASIAVIAARPPLWVMIVLTATYGFGLALADVTRGVFYGHILPAHIRTLGISVLVLAGIPAILIEQPFIFRIPEWGFAGVLFAGTPFLLIAGLIEISAAGLYDRDRRSALASQAASAEYRRARDDEELKLLVCRDVEVAYDGVQVLFGVDFDVDEGEIVALLGTNGAGKSTLLRAISGTQQASGGAIVYDGREITHVPAYEVAERGIAHAPGGRGIFPSLTVKENLELGLWLHKRESAEDDPNMKPKPLAEIDLDEVLEIFPALRERLATPAGALSGGEQQMVSLAQAFLARPRLLMIDELSLGLSPAVIGELLECVRRIHSRGVTIIVVEQSVNVALTLAERAVFMEKGEVKFIGPTKELLRRPDIVRAVYVKGTGALISQTTSSAERRRRLQGLEEQRAILDVQAVSKSFGGVKAVDDVSFALREGEVLGLIGPNGAGKTTIFDVISGFVVPDAGKIVYDGVDVTKMGPDERARLQLIRRFQDARIFPSLSVYESLLVALDRGHRARSMFLAALQLPGVRRSERQLGRRADQLIDLLELGAYRDKFVKELSTGLRRITDIACMLATEPRVLLLDEPSSGIAQAEAESLGPLLQRVRVETGCSILIIEHDMPLISRVADELLALDQGKVVTRGTPDEVLEDKRVIESYLGTTQASIRRSGVPV